MKYEVYSNYGSELFTNEDDAIAALVLFGAYHSVKLEFERNEEYGSNN